MYWELMEQYADIGRSASSIALRLARVEQERETKRDRIVLCDIAKIFDEFAVGSLESHDYPMFTFDGWYVILKVLREFGEFHDKSIKQRVAEIAAMLRSGHKPPAYLRRFFREVHDLAEEITVLGLTTNPVTEVYNALAEERKEV